jgi:hypothetical protein
MDEGLHPEIVIHNPLKRKKERKKERKEERKLCQQPLLYLLNFILYL